jgi:pseudouridine synthase
LVSQPYLDSHARAITKDSLPVGRCLTSASRRIDPRKADPASDRIEVDGKLIQPSNRPQFVYLLLNKPLGVFSTCADPQGRRTVLDLLPDYLRQEQGIHPVGRLDADSTGAILLTNDGELTFQLTHPRHYVAKTYEVWVEGTPSAQVIADWRQGVWLDQRKTLPAKVKVLRRTSTKSLLEVILTEGRNRQIRRVAEQLGHPVIRLHRIAIGAIRLQSSHQPALPVGVFRPLDSTEIDYLKSRIGLAAAKPAARVKEKRI